MRLVPEPVSTKIHFQPVGQVQAKIKNSVVTEKNVYLLCIQVSVPRLVPDINIFFSICDFPGSSDGKESACNAGDLGSVPGLGRSPGGGYGNLLQYSCLENPHGQRSLVGYSPWVTKSQT